MTKLWPILLIGLLSMLFAEVFSGASQMWFISGWGILMTFPLYLAHTIFFLWIALKSRKTSLSQLYMFGILFGLYESWITKVLWAGYMGSAPQIGTFLGIAIGEFAIVTLFWHPLMSFILPILVFEIITGKALIDHEFVLEKTKAKNWLIVLFLILVMSFIANGNKFNIISTNISVIGTFLLVYGVYLLARNQNILSMQFKKRGFIILSVYLIALYLLTFFFLLPERIPTALAPYLGILFLYALAIFLLKKSKKTEVKLKDISKTAYSKKDLLKFMLLIILIANLACFFHQIFYPILIIGYNLLSITGVFIFIKILIRFLFSSNSKK